MSSVFRIQKNQNYTVMSNYHLRDKRLSLKTKGLMSIMLSLPDDWDYSEKGLCVITGEGKDSIKKCLHQLEEYGYLTRHQLRDSSGHMSSSEYILREVPEEDSAKGVQSDSSDAPEHNDVQDASSCDVSKKSYPHKNVNKRVDNEKSDSSSRKEERGEKTVENSETVENTDFSPWADFPTSVKPTTAEPMTAKPHQLTKDILNTNRPNKDITKENGLSIIDEPDEDESYFDGLTKTTRLEKYEKMFQKRVNYSNAIAAISDPFKTLYTELYSLALRVLKSESDVTIKGVKYTYRYLRKKLLLLTEDHIMSVINAFIDSGTEIKSNRNNYFLAALLDIVDSFNLKKATDKIESRKRNLR